MVERNYKLKADQEDLRDRVYYARTVASTRSLPAAVDLRPYCSPIVDQGQLGSCTANAIASGLGEYLQKKSGQPSTPLSRLYIYWWERFMEGTVNTDSGAAIRDGMKVFQQLGCAPEKDWPYNISAFTNEPNPQAILDGINFKIKEYRRINTFNDLKVALAELLPVVVGIKLYESFESNTVAKTGIVPMPNVAKERYLGGHAVLAVGYDDKKQVVIMRNSWGTNWGEAGYFYLPYNYFNISLVLDMWTGQ